jgi:septum formation protein
MAPEGYARLMREPAGIVLASSSKYRIRELARLGICFRSIAPACDEEKLKAATTYLEPGPLAMHLALAKANSVPIEAPPTIVIAGDQLATVDGIVLGKPATRTGAEAQLATLAGRDHLLLTAVAIVRRPEVFTHLDVTRLTMRRLSAAQIERYLDADSPYDCAGSYKIEEHGISLFERVESVDPSAITGFPLIAITTILLGLGVEIPCRSNPDSVLDQIG